MGTCLLVHSLNLVLSLAFFFFFMVEPYERSLYHHRLGRLQMHGKMHWTLVPFLWPLGATWRDVDPTLISNFWKYHGQNNAEAALSSSLCQCLASERFQSVELGPEEDLEAAVALVLGLGMGILQRKTTDDADWKVANLESDSETTDLMGGVFSSFYRNRPNSKRVFKGPLSSVRTDSELQVPTLVSNLHRSQHFQPRAGRKGKGPVYQCWVTYVSISSDFFGRLIVRLRPFATGFDFSSNHGEAHCFV